MKCCCTNLDRRKGARHTCHAPSHCLSSHARKSTTHAAANAGSKPAQLSQSQDNNPGINEWHMCAHSTIHYKPHSTVHVALSCNDLFGAQSRKQEVMCGGKIGPSQTPEAACSSSSNRSNKSVITMTHLTSPGCAGCATSTITSTATDPQTKHMAHELLKTPAEPKPHVYVSVCNCNTQCTTPAAVAPRS
jgi:hypothetical protein